MYRNLRITIDLNVWRPTNALHSDEEIVLSAFGEMIAAMKGRLLIKKAAISVKEIPDPLPPEGDQG